MVSFLERSISVFGIFSLYTYSIYKFIKTKASFNKKFHDSAIIQAKKFISEQSEINPHIEGVLKFVETPGQKLLFLVGFENSENCLSNHSLSLVEKIFENF